MSANDNSKLLFEKIQLLINHSGSIIFSIGEYYVQFAKDKNTEEIYFEAVSHNFLDILPTNLIEEFQNLGFRIMNGENYSKTVLVSSWPLIITDVEQIFLNIYKINYDKDFTLLVSLRLSTSRS